MSIRWDKSVNKLAVFASCTKEKSLEFIYLVLHRQRYNHHAVFDLWARNVRNRSKINIASIYGSAYDQRTLGPCAPGGYAERVEGRTRLLIRLLINKKTSCIFNVAFLALYECYYILLLVFFPTDYSILIGNKRKGKVVKNFNFKAKSL